MELGNQFRRLYQNWHISKSREDDSLADEAFPETIANAAAALGCRSVAFTYNDPVIFHEYAIDVAQACRDPGIKTVAVTAGAVCAEPPWSAIPQVRRDRSGVDTWPKNVQSLM